MKSWYTDGDLLYAFINALYEDEHRESAKDYGKATTMDSHDIISCEVEGFPAGTDYIENGEEPTHFSVEIKMLGLIHAFRVHFYVDLSLNVHLWSSFLGQEHKLYDLERYTLDPEN